MIFLLLQGNKKVLEEVIETEGIEKNGIDEEKNKRR